MNVVIKYVASRSDVRKSKQHTLPASGEMLVNTSTKLPDEIVELLKKIIVGGKTYENQ